MISLQVCNASDPFGILHYEDRPDYGEDMRDKTDPLPIAIESNQVEVVYHVSLDVDVKLFLLGLAWGRDLFHIKSPRESCIR